jgi:hypothetical protein
VSAGEKMLLVPEDAALDGASAIGAIGDGMAVGIEAEDGWEEHARQLKPPPEGTAIVVPFDLTPKDYTIEGWRQAYANAVRLNVQLRTERDAEVERVTELFREQSRLVEEQCKLKIQYLSERDAAVADRDRLRGDEGGADCDCGEEVPGAGCLDVGALHALRKGYALEARVNNERFQETLRLRAECDRLRPLEQRAVNDPCLNCGATFIDGGRNFANLKTEVARLRQALGAVGKLCAIVEALRDDTNGDYNAFSLMSEGPLDEIAKIASSVGVAPEGPLDEIAKIVDPHAGGAECGRPDCRCHLGGRP